jgi:dTDP-4-amino-4,6-dideoxygalactose transaminase
MKSQWTFWKGKPYEPVRDEFLLNHARSGILLALRALGLPSGSGVGVMAYNCHTVFSAVRQAGCQPVFLDVTDSLVLDQVDLAKKRKTIQALIVTHLFGIVNDMDSIRKNYPDLPVIEDCAHAYGLTRLSGDFAVFSVGQGKLPSLGDGGILHANNYKYDEALSRLYSEIPSYSWSQRIRQSFAMWIKSILYKPLIYTLVTHHLKRKRKPFSGTEAIVPRKMSKGIRALYEASLPTLPDVIAKRKRRMAEIEAWVGRLSGVDHVLGGSVNGFMTVVACENVSLVLTCLHQQGIEVETHFGHCIDWAKALGYSEGDCPRTEYLVDHLLMVPTYE